MPPLSEADKQKKLLAARKKLRNFQEKRTAQHGTSTPRSAPGSAGPSSEPTIDQPLPSPALPSPATPIEPDHQSDPAVVLEQVRAELDATQRNYDRVKADLDDAVAKRFQIAQKDKERINRLTQEKQAVESRNRDLLHEITQLQAQLSQQSLTHDTSSAALLERESNEALEKAQQDLAELRKHLDARDAELIKTQMALQDAQGHVDHYRDRFQSLEREIETTTKQHATERDEWKQTMASLQSDHSQSETRLASELQARNDLVATLQTQLETTQHDLNSLHATTTEQANELASLRFELQTAQTDLIQVRAAVDHRAGELSALQSELETAQSNLKASRMGMDQRESDICALRAELQTALDNLKLARTATDQRESDLNSTQTELQTARDELQASQTAVDQRESTLDELRAESRATTQQVTQLQGDICATKERLQQAGAQAAIADEARSRLKAELERAQTDAQQLVATNHNLEAQVATMTSEASRLESTVAALQKVEASLRDELATNADRLQQSESDRETINAQHCTELANLQAQYDATAATTAMQWKSDTAAHKERINQLEAQCAALNAKCQQSADESAKLERQVTTAAAIQETDQRRIQELTSAIQTLHDCMATQKAELAQARQGIETERHAMVKLEGKYQEQCTKATKHQTLIAQLLDQVSAFDRDNTTLVTQVQNARQDHDAALDEVRLREYQVRQSLASLAAQHNDTQTLLAERETAIWELKQALEMTQSRVDSAEHQVQGLQNSLVSLEETNERALTHAQEEISTLEKQFTEHQARSDSLQAVCDNTKHQWQTAEAAWEKKHMQLQTRISELEQQAELLLGQLAQTQTARDDAHRKYIDQNQTVDALQTKLDESCHTVTQMAEAHQTLTEELAQTSRVHDQERAQWQVQVAGLRTELGQWSTLQQSWQTESEELKRHLVQLTAQRTQLQSAVAVGHQHHTTLVSEVQAMRAVTVQTLEQYRQQLGRLSATVSAFRATSQRQHESHNTKRCMWEQEKSELLTQLAATETQLTQKTEHYTQQQQHHADELAMVQEQLVMRDHAHTALQTKLTQRGSAIALFRRSLGQAIMELVQERELLLALFGKHQCTLKVQIAQLGNELQLLYHKLITQAENQQTQRTEAQQQHCALQQQYDRVLADVTRIEQESHARLASVQQDCAKSVATAKQTVVVLRAQIATQVNLYQQAQIQWHHAVVGLRADVDNAKAQHQHTIRNLADVMTKICKQAAQALQGAAYSQQKWTDQILQSQVLGAQWSQRLHATEEAHFTLTAEVARVQTSKAHELTIMRQAWQAEVLQVTATRRLDQQRLETLEQTLVSQRKRWQTHTSVVEAAFSQVCSDLERARVMQVTELNFLRARCHQLRELSRGLRWRMTAAWIHCQGQVGVLANRLESTLSSSQARVLALHDSLSMQTTRIETALRRLPAPAATGLSSPTAALSPPPTGSSDSPASVQALKKKNVTLAAKLANAQRQWRAQEHQLLAQLEVLQTQVTGLRARPEPKQAALESATIDHALASKERELATLQAHWEHRSETWQAKANTKATSNDRNQIDANRRQLIALKVKNAQLAKQLSDAYHEQGQFRGPAAQISPATGKPPASPNSLSNLVPAPSTSYSPSALKKRALLQKARQISAQRATKKLLNA
ncbi:hypothetical protein H4R34_003038 [Dimargaris verticillata]|uniref:Uncharacterized protein n=1 Tax=Dimargaris verticillata TaxID=2761393 RepID=A0A9W8E9E6_9FUNG|nr:hypothetical protein H4R34_003038 [Dimargaris verticillata]